MSRLPAVCASWDEPADRDGQVDHRQPDEEEPEAVFEVRL
jgi:hypothetical protein